MWLAVIYNFRLALLRESDGANKHGAAVARGGISPMSSSPTYSDALHCEQKMTPQSPFTKVQFLRCLPSCVKRGQSIWKWKWRHVEQTHRESKMTAWILSSQCSARPQPDKVFPALLSQRSSSQAAVGGFVCGSSIWKMFAKGGRMNKWFKVHTATISCACDLKK